MDFGIFHDPVRGLKAYFEENPVNANPLTGQCSFTTYVENTGNVDIILDTLHIDYYDVDGNYQSTQDATGSISSWLKND